MNLELFEFLKGLQVLLRNEVLGGGGLGKFFERRLFFFVRGGTITMKGRGKRKEEKKKEKDETKLARGVGHLHYIQIYRI